MLYHARVAPCYEGAGIFSECDILRPVGAKRLTLLNLGPNHINTRGIGIIMAPIHQMRVPAHCTPRFWNNCLENKGKVAPTPERRIVLAAKTEAAL